MFRSKHFSSFITALECIDVEVALKRTTDRIVALYGDIMDRVVRAWWQANDETRRMIDEIALTPRVDWLFGPPKQPVQVRKRDPGWDWHNLF